MDKTRRNCTITEHIRPVVNEGLHCIINAGIALTTLRFWKETTVMPVIGTCHESTFNDKCYFFKQSGPLPSSFSFYGMASLA